MTTLITAGEDYLSCDVPTSLVLVSINSFSFVSAFGVGFTTALMSTRATQALEPSRARLFIAHVIFITFKPWLSGRVFRQGCLASSVHDEVAAYKMYQH